MFSWYRNSEYRCVYLADVAPAPDPMPAPVPGSGWDLTRDGGQGRFQMPQGSLTPASMLSPVPEKWWALQKSEWFERGWTLQELLAPNCVLFCNSAWEMLGHKCSHHPTSPRRDDEGPSLIERIARATNIRTTYLRHPQAYTKASVACRMSWASKRKTTRIEDITYCLLGIFGVHLPPLYGEGINACRRLQEEILRHSNDQSISVWFDLDRYLKIWEVKTWDMLATPILALHPTEFSSSEGVAASREVPNSPYAIPNNGLELRVDTQQFEIQMFGRVILTTYLNCMGGPQLPPSLSSKDKRRPNTCIAIIHVGNGPHDLMRLRLRPSAGYALGYYIVRGQSQKLLHVKTEGTPHVSGAFFGRRLASIDVPSL